MSGRTVQLGEVVSITSGFAFESAQFSDAEGLPLVRIRDVQRGYSDTRYNGKYDAKYLIDNGDLLISMDGEFGIAPWRGGKSLLNQRVCRIEPILGVSHGPYLLHALPKKLKDIEDVTPFATVKHLSVKTIRAILLHLPPIEEQRRIAAILDKADAIRRKREDGIRLTEELLRSTFLEMFGDLTTNEKNWNSFKLGELIEDGPQNGLYRPASDYGSGTLIVRIDGFRGGQHLTSGMIEKRLRLDDSTKRLYQLRDGDLLINRVNSRSHLGKATVVSELQEPVVFESNIMRLTLKTDRTTPNYILACLGQPALSRQIQSAAKDAVNQASINQVDVRGLCLPLPPLELQQSFSTASIKIRRIVMRMIEAKEVQQKLFASLVQRAFRGKL